MPRLIQYCFWRHSKTGETLFPLLKAARGIFSPSPHSYLSQYCHPHAKQKSAAKVTWWSKYIFLCKIPSIVWDELSQATAVPTNSSNQILSLQWAATLRIWTFLLKLCASPGLSVRPSQTQPCQGWQYCIATLTLPAVLFGCRAVKTMWSGVMSMIAAAHHYPDKPEKPSN